MEKILSKGQVLFGIAITVFGIEDLICAHLGLTVRGVPWFPVNSFLACLTGIALIVAGLSIVANIRARLTATLLGILFLLHALLLEASKVIAKPGNMGIRTVFLEALSLCASALVLAGVLPAGGPVRRGGKALDTLIGMAPYLLAVSAVVFGADHFIGLAFISTLVPAWMHAGRSWVCLTGAGFIAAGISIAAKKMDQWAAFLLGTMFLLWFLLLHAPRVVRAFHTHDPNAPNEWSSAFIALGLCGGYWIYAWSAWQRRHRNASPRRA